MQGERTSFRGIMSKPAHDFDELKRAVGLRTVGCCPDLPHQRSPDTGGPGRFCRCVAPAEPQRPRQVGGLPCGETGGGVDGQPDVKGRRDGGNPRWVQLDPEHLHQLEHAFAERRGLA